MRSTDLETAETVRIGTRSLGGTMRNGGFFFVLSTQQPQKRDKTSENIEPKTVTRLLFGPSG